MGNPKFRIRSIRKLYLLFLLISAVIAAVVVGFFYFNGEAYELKVVEQLPVEGKRVYLHHDFDRDGWTERIQVENNTDQDQHYLRFYNHQGSVLDQANFSESIVSDWISFGDYTGDNYDEIFVFTQSEDSLYLSVIDLNPNRWILKRHFINSVKQPNPYHTWDVAVRGSVLLDVDKDGKKELVFVIQSGLSIHPRGVYIFDLEKRILINQIEVAAGLSASPIIFDLTGDGNEEIILVGDAIGNTRENSQYTDFKCWLFILDQELKPVFPPSSFGEYPSKLYCNPITIKNDKYLLIAYSYTGNKTLPNYLYLLNSLGKITVKKPLEEKGLRVPIVIQGSNLHSEIWLTFGQDGVLMCLDTDLKIMGKIKVDFEKFLFLIANDLDRDGFDELISSSSRGLHIFNKRFQEVAAFSPGERLLFNTLSFQKNGLEKSIDITVNSATSFYRLVFRQDTLYYWLPIVYAGLVTLCFLGLVVSYRVFTFLYIYTSYFLYSLRKSYNGILIVDFSGNVLYMNKRLQTLLAFPERKFKRRHFCKVLEEYPEIIHSLEKSLSSSKTYTNSLTFNRFGKQFKGEIKITPFTLPISIVCHYLVEIFDHTEPVLSERLKIWSRTMQKIAHDIKTPLSSVILNLDSLQIRLDETDLKDNQEFRDDIQLMQNELIKIRDLTKNFLKFADLERPNFQAVNLRELIDQSLTQFRHMVNERLRIQVESDKDIKDVWVDPGQLQLVFHILIENAIDAMNGKGLIQINLNLAHDLLNSELEFVDIEICDTGPGIPAEVRDKIFEPYFTTKKEGTGMGLTIAKKIVEDNGGQINLYSKENFGTVIRLGLPLANGESPA